MSQQKTDYIDETDIDSTLDELPDDETIEETVSNLEDHGFEVVVVDSADEALETIQSHIPAGASVMNGHSTTLEEIGFIDYLSEGDHEWESLPDEIWSIDDDAERQAARRKSQTADYFLGGINAIAQTGELVAADLSGSRIGAYPFAAGNVVIVSGANKIVPTLEDALDRLESVAYPLENERAQEAYGV
ncbi:MAG: lactate utilization protein, partial [Halobellus sp.]|uniref:lactate utilization protein n=1 Tax=Halobellus sp. TaxID=1979212 RepID=UPI0035D4FDB6